MRIIFDLWFFTLVVVAIVALLALVAWFAYRRGQQSGGRWRWALEQLPLGVAVFARKRRVFANPPAEETLPQLDQTALEHLLHTAGPRSAQSTVLRGANGLAVQAQAVRLAGQHTTVLALRDIAGHQRAEQGYHKLIHMLSHELLSPLTAVQGHLAHIAASDRHDEAAWFGSVRVARDEVDRLTRLTANLLILSRLETGQPLQRRPTNLAAVAEECALQLLEKADERHTTLTVHAAPRLPRPLVDRDAWKQVLLNLVDNAIKYGRSPGTVAVTLQQEAADLVIAVADDGPGIPPDDVPHLFDELYRGESQRHISGTGLGLAIVRQIVVQHGGRIVCTSTLHHGTTFQITLPLASQDVTTS